MKPLNIRHEQRAQRKADNMAESNQDYAGNNVGAISLMMDDVQSAMARLTPEERDQLEEMRRQAGDFDPEGDKTVANNEDGLSMAGIGVLNPFVVPPARAVEYSADGVLPDARFDPSQGNANGAAVAAATSEPGKGWGTGGSGAGGAGGTPDDGYNNLSNAELKTELDGRKVAYGSSANKEALVQLLRNDDKAKAGN